MRVKRFAYVCADPGIPLPGTKGASIHVASVCRALCKAGLSGEIFTIRPEGESLDGVPLRRIPIPPRRKHKSPEEREARLFLASLNTSIAGESKPDLIYERYTLWHTGGLARARALEIPFVLEVNSPLPEEASRFRHLANRPLADGIAQLLLREADGIVCVSQEVANWVRRQRGHSEGVWMIPNGVDPELFHRRPGHRLAPLPPREVPLVAFSGSFRPWHGLEELLDAFTILVEQEVTNAHLLCVGDGPVRLAMEEKARESGLAERVHFTGQVSHCEVADWLASADVAVAPYPDLEGFYFSPLKIFEFLCLGLPVVSTTIGQVPELIPHEERGFLCSPGNPRELAGGMAHLIRDRKTARRLGDAGREWVLSHATWGKRVEEILRLVEGLS